MCAAEVKMMWGHKLMARLLLLDQVTGKMIHQRKLLNLVKHYRPSNLVHSGLSQRLAQPRNSLGTGI